MLDFERRANEEILIALGESISHSLFEDPKWNLDESPRSSPARAFAIRFRLTGN